MSSFRSNSTRAGRGALPTMWTPCGQRPNRAECGYCHRATPTRKCGIVLADGEIAGTWRARKTGRNLTLTIKMFQSLNADLGTQLRDEADQVAELGGASALKLEFDEAAI